MNNAALKKWAVLVSLLLVTLILVWQAPEPEQAEPVSAVKPVNPQPARSVVPTTDPDAERLTLKPRQKGGETVDLFAVPETPKPKPAARPVVNKPVETRAEKRVELPFDYIGMLRSGQTMTLFLMEGSRLYLVHEGDTVNGDFRLQRIDVANNELVWLYLPSNETRKMSMDQ